MFGSNMDSNQRISQLRTKTEVIAGQEEGNRQVHTNGAPMAAHERLKWAVHGSNVLPIISHSLVVSTVVLLVAMPLE
jgi:hypothetical protein